MATRCNHFEKTVNSIGNKKLHLHEEHKKFLLLTASYVFCVLGYNLPYHAIVFCVSGYNLPHHALAFCIPGYNLPHHALVFCVPGYNSLFPLVSSHFMLVYNSVIYFMNIMSIVKIQNSPH